MWWKEDLITELKTPEENIDLVHQSNNRNKQYKLEPRKKKAQANVCPKAVSPKVRDLPQADTTAGKNLQDYLCTIVMIRMVCPLLLFLHKLLRERQESH